LKGKEISADLKTGVGKQQRATENTAENKGGHTVSKQEALLLSTAAECYGYLKPMQSTSCSVNWAG
jgi:hypothetical protein